jgi:hypothetical protein
LPLYFKVSLKFTKQRESLTSSKVVLKFNLKLSSKNSKENRKEKGKENRILQKAAGQHFGPAREAAHGPPTLFSESVPRPRLQPPVIPPEELGTNTTRRA